MHTGLATAYTLARAGHKVLILEKSDGAARVSTLYVSESAIFAYRWKLAVVRALVECNPPQT